MFVRLARLGAGNQRQATAHPEMDRQPLATLDPDQQVLAAPLEGLDPPPGERAERAAVEPLSQSLRPDLDALDPAPDEARLEAAAQDFDLGQLGHGAILCRRA